MSRSPASSHPSRALRWLSTLLIDVTPFRASSDFRWLFTSQVFTMSCRQVVVVAMPLQVYLITRSSLWVGLLGMVQAIAIVSIGLYGGSLVDRFDRRSVQMVCKTIAAASSLGLTLGSIHGVGSLWLVLTFSAVGTGAYMLDQSARAATIPRLVSPDLLPSAVSLGMVLTRAGAVAGPAIGGIVIATAGLPWAYAIDVAGFVPGMAFLLPLGPHKPVSEDVVLGLRAPLEALAFVRKTPILISTFVADLNATIFGMPTAVFPALALNVFGVGPAGLGLLYAADGAGSLITTLISGWVRRVERQGLFIIGAIVVWGLAIAAFGLTGRIQWLGLVLLAVAGAADMISAVFRQTILQVETPDRLRGRMSAFNMMVVTTGPRLGDLEAGAVAALFNPIFSVVSGGVLTVAGIAVVAVTMPLLRKYRRSARANSDVRIDPTAPLTSLAP